jgi:flagellar protein FliL
MAAQNPGHAAKPTAEAASEKEAAPAPKSGGGIQPWLPLILNLVLMPVLAYATVSFLILPKMKAGAETPAAHAESGKGEEKGGAHSTKEGGSKGKLTLPLGGKVLVNVAGTMGTRYLLANLTLVSSNQELKVLLEKHDAELRDAAASTLSVKTIGDLEKPGARNLIRTELISVFNNILGEGTVTDLYLTEFAIQ